MTEKTDTSLDVQAYEQQHYGILIEGLLDQGLSEDEVAEAVEAARTALPEAA